MINLQPALLAGRLKGALKIVCDALFAELLLNTVDDGHDALDIPVEDVTYLQTLERDLTIVVLIVRFWLAFLAWEGHGEALVCYVCDNRRELFLR